MKTFKLPVLSLLLFFAGSSLFLLIPKCTLAQAPENNTAMPDTNLAIELYKKAKQANSVGNMDSTEIWLAEALPIFKASGLWQYQVKTYHTLCGVNYRTRRAEKAGQLLDTAFQILTSKTDTSNFLYAPYYHNRATVYYVLGEYQEAKKQFFKAIDHYSRFPETMNSKIVNSYNNLGLTFTKLNDYENAVIYLKECLDFNLRFNPDNKYLIGRSHNNLGVAYFQKGGSESERYDFDYFSKDSYKKAEEHYLAALDNYKYILTPPNIALGQCYLNLANTSGAHQNHQQSIAYRKLALVNFGADTDDPHPHVAMIYYNTGISCKIVGHYDSSRYYLNKAIAMREGLSGEKHFDLADYYNYLGRVYLAENLLEEALQNFQQSLIISCINFNDTLYSSNPDSKQVLLKHETMKNFAWKALALKEKYDISEDINDMVMALENYYLFNDMVKIILSEFTNEEAKLSFMQSVHENYADIMEICFDLYTKTSEPKYLEDAMYFSENEKSATLSAFIDNSLAKKFSGMTKKELQAEELAQENLFAIENEFRNLRLNANTDSLLLAMMSDSLIQARFACEKIALAMDEKYTRYADIKYDRKKNKLEDIQTILAQKNSSSLEYFLTDTAIYSIAINANDYCFHKETIDSTFFIQIADYRKSTSDYRFINEDSDLAYSMFTESSWALHQTLFPKNIREILLQYPKIVIIPNGVLSYISFDGLLSTEPAGRNYEELDYLANDYILSYANALRYIQINDEGKSPTNNYAGYAPEYDEVLLASAMESEEFAIFRENPGLLKEHKAEVSYAGKILEGDAFIGHEASEWNFKQNAGDYNILHFAMHAQINDENPLSSKFLFSQYPDNKNEDNFLNTHEIYGLNLNAQLVVLSACNTASGVLRKGEGVMSLSRAFMYAGVSSIVSSLWLAEDHAAHKIMSGFFDGIKQGLPIDEALHQSRTRYLKTADPVFSHPYYWANFILIGNNAPVKRISMFPYKTLGLTALAGLLLFGLIFIGYLRRR